MPSKTAVRSRAPAVTEAPPQTEDNTEVER